MTPPPARLLAVAPGFHSRVTWADRLLLGAGRVPTEEELAMLVLDDPRADLRDCLCLFQIPAHMRSAFWTMLERAGELPPDDAERYFTSVARFFEYKHFAAPPGAEGCVRCLVGLLTKPVVLHGSAVSDAAC